MKPHQLKRLGYCAIYRHDNPQEARHVGILGAERRAPPLVRRSPAVTFLLARIAKHVEYPDAKIERTWPPASLKELDPPMQRLLVRLCQGKPCFHAICGEFKQKAS
jgi:hypothetical protein